MRTYLIDIDSNEYIIDLTKTIVHSSDLIEFEFSMNEENTLKNIQRVFIRKLAGKYFVSRDNRKWGRLARQTMPKILLNINTVFDMYRGYKPSGLSEGSEGELFTKMPGKVVKINVEIGQKVEVGETLLILEAMKMENEIKSGMSGIIKSINVKEGEALEQGVLLMEIEE